MTKPVTRLAAQRQDPPGQPPPCACCGCAASEPTFTATVPGFRVERCPDCGLGRTWPALAPAELGRCYPDAYYGRGNARFNRAFEALTRWFRRRRARLLRERVPLGAVLDVGCGRGIMLDHLRGLGYEPHGIELSETAAWHARRVLGLDVETGDFPASRREPGRFQAVIFWHSLEHLRDPFAALARARELLRPGGLLAVAVPNFDSLQARLFGRRWFHLDIPRHQFHFGLRSLEAALARQGLRVVRVDHFCLEQNPFGWLQSFCNALGFPENLLYDFLKSPTARLGEPGRHPAALALTAVVLAPLLALALALTALDALLRQGGTIEVYAVKE